MLEAKQITFELFGKSVRWLLKALFHSTGRPVRLGLDAVYVRFGVGP